MLHLEPGDLIPADGVYISGHNIKCDESSATGESDQMKKTSGEQVLSLLVRGHNDGKDLDPFIISGSKVLEGVGTYLGEFETRWLGACIANMVQSHP